MEDEKNSAPADLVVDGDESSVSDFLIEHLNEYIQSEGYLDRKANYEAITAIRKITYLSRGLLTFRQITLVRTSCPFMSLRSKQIAAGQSMVIPTIIFCS